VIVVTAAGGLTGSAVVRALWSRGERVRALVGSSQPRPELTALSADVAAVDLTDPAAVEPLLAGADALYVIWPNFDPEETAGVVALLGAARRAGVPRVVYHSVLRPQIRAMPHHAAKDQVEEALDASGLAWRVLQPCAYADNLDGQLEDVPDGPVPVEYAARCSRLMFDHYRAHGFTGSPRVLEALLGRPARTFAEHLRDQELPPATSELP